VVEPQESRLRLRYGRRITNIVGINSGPHRRAGRWPRTGTPSRANAGVVILFRPPAISAASTQAQDGAHSDQQNCSCFHNLSNRRSRSKPEQWSENPKGKAPSSKHKAPVKHQISNSKQHGRTAALNRPCSKTDQKRIRGGRSWRSADLRVESKGACPRARCLAERWSPRFR
jgi:hypothetical protein